MKQDRSKKRATQALISSLATAGQHWKMTKGKGRFATSFCREQVLHRFNAGDDNKKSTNDAKAIGLLIIFSIGLAVVASEPVVRSSHGDLPVNLILQLYLCLRLLLGFGLHH